jgi:CTP synthase
MRTKYIFVSGGVISSLGKGLATSSIGTLLKARGLKVGLLKIDPYINVDPGTLSPYQHGEVFVTDDGAECDLDIGHYERFLGSDLSQKNNFTTGRIYHSVIEKERQGKYLGNTVQVVPHIINEIIERIESVTAGTDIEVLITELGGTVGDIESLPFLEALRQFTLKHKDDVLHIHLTLVPYIASAGEIKTKPAQHSVKKLNELGIWPKVLLCRTQEKLSRSLKEKLSLFCNVEPDAIIDAVDVPDIYEIPLSFKDQRLDDRILDYLGLQAPPSPMKEWKEMLHILKNPSRSVKIGIIGKYIELRDAYKSIMESFKHAGIANDCKVELEWIAAEKIESGEDLPRLQSVSGVLIPGGFGERGIEGKILTAKYAREKKVPYFGICLGMQVAVIEFSRSILGLAKANSTEVDPKTPYPVVAMMEDKKYLENYGGTLRLGKYECDIVKGSLANDVYGKTKIFERHRHRYEVNNTFREKMENAGLVVSGINPERDLVEIVELPREKHPFFIAGQFHPEFRSRPLAPHPLFVRFVKAALDRAANGG